MPGPTPVSDLDQIAASIAGCSYKQQLLDPLDLRPDHAVLDVGCGPGTDVATLAAAVSPGGTVIGVNNDPAMITEARRRTAGLSRVEVRDGDAHAPPVDAGSIDRARADRVLIHLDSPPRALAELRRVLRPGGLLTLSEPDWDTLAIDHPDLAISWAFTHFIAERANRNQAMGRQLARLTVAGFTILAVRNATPAFTDFAAAETMLELRRNTELTITAGYLTREADRQWITHLTTQPFTGACIMFPCSPKPGTRIQVTFPRL